jgi:hypothetical protein
MDPLDDILGVTNPAVDDVDIVDALIPADSGDVPVVVGEPVSEAIARADTPDIKDLETDFDIARKAIKDALEKVGPVLDEAIVVASAGSEPRAYEVVATLMGNLVDASKKLMDIHVKRKDVKDEPRARGNSTVAPAGGTVNIDRAVFVGRASDLLREIKRLQKGGSDAPEN